MSGEPPPEENWDFDDFETHFTNRPEPPPPPTQTAPTFEGWDFGGEHAVFAQLASRNGGNLQNQEFYKFEQLEDASLASLFPSLAGSAVSAVTFRHTSLEIWAKPIGSRPAGIHFSTEIIMKDDLPPDWNSSLGLFFPDGFPTFRISAHFNAAQNPNDTLSQQGLVLQGSVFGLRVPLIPSVVTLVSIGAQMTVGKPMAPAVAYELIGQLLFTIPGSITPLLLNFGAEFNGDMVTLKMSYEQDWRNALGVSGFHLKTVKFQHTVNGAKKLAERKAGITKSTEAEPATVISAEWATSKYTLEVKGEIFHGDEFKKSHLSCSLQRMTWVDICDLYTEITGSELGSIEHDIVLDKLTLQVSLGMFKIEGKVTVNGHAAAAASIIISPNGITISGELSKFNITDDLFIEKAALSLQIGNGKMEDSGVIAPTKPAQSTPTVVESTKGGSSSEKPPGAGGVAVPPGQTQQSKGFTTSLRLLGNVSFKDMHFRVVVTMHKASSGGFEWMVEGEAAFDTLSLRNLITSIDKGNPIDVQLRNVRIVAASFNRPPDSLHPAGIEKGIFVTALLDTVPGIDQKALGTTSKSESFVLSAGYSPEKGITACIALPETLQIRMGDRCSSDRLALVISSSAQLTLTARIKLQLEKQPTPLVFNLAANITPGGFNGYLSMAGRIENPFDLGKKIALGDFIALDVGYTWAALPTGVPTKFGIAGGVMVDQDKYEMALMFGANPMDMLLKLDIKYFSLEKLVSFAGALMDVEFEISASKLIELHEVHVYASQGCHLADRYYAAGYLLQGRVVVCGHNGSVDCTISWSEGFKFKATMDGFQLGPLTVAGANGEKNPIVEVELTHERQKFLLSGMVEIFNLRVEVFVDCEWHPNPTFAFRFDLAWSTLLHVEVKAKMVPSGDLAKPGDHDFEVYAVFEQRIIRDLTQSILDALESAHKAAQQKLENAQQAVRDAKLAFQRAIQEKEEALAAASREADAKEEELRNSLEALEKDHVSKTSQINGEKLAKIEEGNTVREEARKKGKQEVSEKETKLTGEQNEHNRLKNEETNEVNSKCHAVNEARSSFSSRFGNVSEDLRRAEDGVHRAQGELSNVEREIQNLENELRDAGMWRTIDIKFQIPVLKVELLVKRAALDVEESILSIARRILDSQLFKDLTAMLDRAQELFESTKKHFLGLLSKAMDAIRLAEEALEIAALAAAGYTEEAERRAKDLEREADKLWTSFVADFEMAVKEEKLRWERLTNSTGKFGVNAAKAALEAVRKDETVWRAAEGGLQLIKDGEAAGYEALKSAITAAGTLVDIQKMELKGTLRASSDYCDPFDILVEGVIAGKAFKFEGKWNPNETGELIADVCGKAVKAIVGL